MGEARVVQRDRLPERLDEVRELLERGLERLLLRLNGAFRDECASLAEQLNGALAGASEAAAVEEDASTKKRLASGGMRLSSRNEVFSFSFSQHSDLGLDGQAPAAAAAPASCGLAADGEAPTATVPASKLPVVSLDEITVTSPKLFLSSSGEQPPPAEGKGRAMTWSSEPEVREPAAAAVNEELCSNLSGQSLGLAMRHRRGYLAGQLKEARRLSLYSTSTGDSAAAAEEGGQQPQRRRSLLTAWRLARFVVAQPAFDALVMLLVAANLVVVALGIDHRAATLQDGEPAVFGQLERFFCAAFTLELAVRLTAFGRKFFTVDGRGWNIFDVFVVASQWAEIIVGAALKLSDDDTVVGSKARGNVQVLRILRLARILRVIRTLRMAKELRAIVVSIIGTLRTLWWTLVLLASVIFTVACVTTEVVSQYLMTAPEAAAGSAIRRELQGQWGSLPIGMLSLFQAISNGKDWEVIVEPLIKHISVLMAVPTLLYVGFGVFALMNVVTGVFVDSALESAKKEQERFLLGTVKKLFQTTDEDQSGEISWTEFKNKLNHQDMHVYFKTIDLDITEAEDLFKLIDIDGNGSIDPEEFVNGCLRLRGPAKAIDLATLMHEFQHRTRLEFARSQRLSRYVYSLLRVKPTAGAG